MVQKFLDHAIFWSLQDRHLHPGGHHLGEHSRNKFSLRPSAFTKKAEKDRKWTKQKETLKDPMECFILIFRIHHQNVPFLVRKQKAPMQPSPISITGSFANCESLQRWSKFRSQDPSLKNLDSLPKCGSKFIQKMCTKYTHKSLDRGVGRTQSYTCRTYKQRLFYAVFCSDT